MPGDHCGARVTGPRAAFPPSGNTEIDGHLECPRVVESKLEQIAAGADRIDPHGSGSPLCFLLQRRRRTKSGYWQWVRCDRRGVCGTQSGRSSHLLGTGNLGVDLRRDRDDVAVAVCATRHDRSPGDCHGNAGERAQPHCVTSVASMSHGRRPDGSGLGRSSKSWGSLGRVGSLPPMSDDPLWAGRFRVTRGRFTGHLG